MNNETFDILDYIPTQEEFIKKKLSVKQEKNTHWSENFAKKILIRLGVKFILPIDRNKKINIKEKVKTPDFIIGRKLGKIKFLSNNNCYFYVDIKEVTGAMYSNLKLESNPIKKLFEDWQLNINRKHTIMISEFNDNIIDKLLNQIYIIDDKYGKLRNCGKTGIVFTGSKIFNEATNLHFLKLIDILFSKITDIYPNKELFNLKYQILTTQKNELVTIVISFKEVFKVEYLSFIALFANHSFKGLKLFFVDTDNYEKYKNDKDFKWLVKLIKKQKRK